MTIDKSKQWHNPDRAFWEGEISLWGLVEGKG